MRKDALAVFNPQNPVERGIQEAYQRADGRWLTWAETRAVVESLLNYSGLAQAVASHPEATAEAVFQKDTQSPYVHIPCHQIELREILTSGQVVSTGTIAALSGAAAKRLLQHYDLILVLDPSRLPKPLQDLTGIKIYDRTLPVVAALVRILTRERLDSDAATGAVKVVMEVSPGIEVFPAGQVPGIAVPKVAEKVVQDAFGNPIADLRKFIVFIPAIGMKKPEAHNARNEQEAVENALNEEFHKTGLPHRDPKFTASYWQSSGFWDQLVWPADRSEHQVMSSRQLKKTAQSSDGRIELSQQEQQIFQLLLKINQKYNLGLTFRVAGGWVRDKMMGKESDDIDIALDKMTGADFGKYIAKETGKSGNVIKANPDQSKHLETMTTNLFGLDVDFVNLRSESYGDSRIPEMEFGSPEVDAQRRDLTINALFYNVNEGKVEDFTGKGIQDLQSKTLRTPLDPVKTFMDDPLRILRMLRFYSRYGGSQIDPVAVEAMKNPQVQQALKAKVSPERVMTEWKKLFAGENQTESLRILHDTGLWETLFSDNLMGRKGKDGQPAQKLHPFTMDQKNKWHVDNVFEHTLKVVKEYDAILRADGVGDEERANSLIAAFLHDLGKLDQSIIGIKDTAEGVFQSYHGHEDVSALVSRSILEGLKASNEDVEYISNLVQNHMVPHDKMTDKTLRKLIRTLGRNLVRRVIQHAKADANSKPGADLAHYDELLNRSQSITPSAPDNNNNAPVVNGQILMSMFPQLKPASGFIREINRRLQDMKDDNPNLTEQEFIASVEQMRPEIESQFGAYNGAKKNMQKPPTAPQLPAVAHNWYGTFKAAEAQQLCGVVLKKVVGLYEKNPTLVLETPQTMYALRLTGEEVGTNGLDTLEKLIGRTICALGIVEDGLFVVSKWQELRNDNNAGAVKMQREQPSEMTTFREGDRVRKRKRGLAFDQIEGVVQEIDPDKQLMFVRWNGIKDLEVFKLTDTVALHAIIEKV